MNIYMHAIGTIGAVISLTILPALYNNQYLAFLAIPFGTLAFIGVITPDYQHWVYYNEEQKRRKNE